MVQKKMTKTKLKTITAEIFSNAEKMWDECGIEYDKDSIRIVPYIADEKSLFKCKCKKCGCVWDTEDKTEGNYYAYVNRNYPIVCPSCGNKTTIYESENPMCDNRVYVYGKRQDGVSYALSYSPYRKGFLNDQLEDPLHHLDETCVFLSKPRFIVCYEENAGICVYGLKIHAFYNVATFGTIKSPYVQSMFRDINDVAKDSFKAFDFEKKEFDVNAFATEWNDIRVKAENSNASKTSRKQSAVVEAQNVRQKYEGESHDDLIRDAIKPVVLKLKARIGHKETYECTCKKCGHTFTYEYDTYFNLSEFACEKCGNDNAVLLNPPPKLTYFNERKRVLVLTYEKTSLPENDLLLRIYESYMTASETKSKEIERLFVHLTKNGKLKLMFYAMCYDDEWCSIRKNSRTRGWDYPKTVIQTPDEIRSAIEQSCMAHTGLIEAIGVGDKAYKPVLLPSDPLDYILQYEKSPEIELVAKGNVPEILKSLLDNNEYLLSGSALHEVLGLTKKTVKIAREMDMNYKKACTVDRLVKVDQSITADGIRQLLDSGVTIEQYTTLREEMPIPLSNVLSYLESCHNYQYIEAKAAIQIWIDYLRMAKKCNYDLKDKTRRFPSSLKKEHDGAVFVFNKLRDEFLEEGFAVNAKKNKALEYSHGDYFVKIPETPNDVVEEATAQHNCLRSYIERISDGKSIIAFVRKKAEPDRSYVTVEISPEMSIVQVKGYCNSNPKGEKLGEFFSKWRTAKKLTSSIRIG